ncbi:dihydroxyacetone kinase subunit DhaL [Thermovenabulum gondwanense]|uniref:phosphoenolpyruvate--glycerone phosphotransferase n=1 Tax=Thermovenabulum gondwanense TaxID=520767 RepID=A0A162MEG5_9FIRM|nr:dihydroxyacetone kinase subunit DhaL [Thermovenabulum gondwanense]KYO65478.1 PTS-dependent dihydroxyacetone kinase, ADP-binding subunit DhaL [Thermovenabulum gondwanense]
MPVTAKELIEILRDIYENISANKEYLTQLDSAIGDADHGINLTKGFKSVMEKIENMGDKDCGSILKTVGMTLVSTVGGASGPLYGTAFMRAGQVVAQKTSIDFEDYIKILEAALDGIKTRGKAEKGEKTIVDTLEPAIEEIKINKDKGKDIALELSLKAAEKGMEYTKEIIAKKGRASYLGERSIGHQDPGATSCYIILKTVADKILKK